jgi:hypothetical protein
MTPPGPDLHVFIIRARREPREIPDAPSEWRFWIEHHPSGAQHYFREFADVLAFMAEYLPADAMPRMVTPPPE